MLVLSRKPGQEIIIGRDVSIRVLGIHGNRVRIGITAPDAVAIRREELCRAIDLSTERADSLAAEFVSASDEAVQ